MQKDTRQLHLEAFRKYFFVGTEVLYLSSYDSKYYKCIYSTDVTLFIYFSREIIHKACCQHWKRLPMKIYVSVFKHQNSWTKTAAKIEFWYQDIKYLTR